MEKDLRQMIKRLEWTFLWLLYGTTILAIVLHKPDLLVYPFFTYVVAVVWFFAPVCVYWYFVEKEEKHEVKEDDAKRMEEFNRQMLSSKQTLRQKSEQQTDGID